MVMTPEAFYSRVGDRFGATAGRSNPHRGQDFPWPARTEIPAFRDLTYLATHHHGGLGHVAVGRGSDGVIVGFSHLYQACQWQPGAIIRKGQVVGLVGNTGSWSDGNHLHLSASRTSHLPWSGPVIDPLAYVHQSFSSVDTGIVDAGSSSTTNIEEEEMKMFVGDNGIDWFLYGPGGIMHIRNPDHLTALRVVMSASRPNIGQIKIAESYFWAMRHGYKTNLSIDFSV